MLNRAIIKEKDINKILYDAGYRIGYQGFKRDAGLDDKKAVIWCYGGTAICVTIGGGELQSIITGRGSNIINTYNKSYRQAINEIVRAINSAEPIPAMEIFSNIMFRSYDDNTKKAKAFLDTFNEFSPQLQSIYSSEAEALKVNCVPTVTFSELDVFKEEKTGLYKYIESVVGNEYILATVPRSAIGHTEIRDIRELTSINYKKIDISKEDIFTVMDKLLSAIIIAFKPYFTPEYTSKEFGIMIPEIEYKAETDNVRWCYTRDNITTRIYCTLKDIRLKIHIDIASVFLHIDAYTPDSEMIINIDSSEVIKTVVDSGIDIKQAMYEIVTAIIKEFKPIIGRDYRYNKFVDIANAYNDLLKGDLTQTNKTISNKEQDSDEETIKVTRQAVESNWIQKLLGRKEDRE